jgi:hypothetical protein
MAREPSTYPPLDVLKPVADGIWIVDSGPLKSLGLEIPVRMTVIRLADGTLWLHSPTRCDEALARQLEGIGRIAHLVAPNIAHWTFLKEWQARYPDAVVWAAPGLRERKQVKQSGIRLDHDIRETAPQDWTGEIDQEVVRGFKFREIAFFHKSSKTLLLTDTIQNFEPEKVSALARPALRLLGTLAPDGKAPVYLRLIIKAERQRASEAVRRMIGWAPERVVFAHGRWFDRNGTEELRRAFRWLVPEEG